MATAATKATLRAGCGRERPLPAGAASELDWAYLDLAYPECPACPHRVVPDAAAPFCTWRAADAPHPFAALAGWDVGA